MRTSKEIIETLTDDEGLDMVKAMETFDEELGGDVNLKPLEAFALVEAHMMWAIQYLAGLIIQVGAEAGVLPQTIDEDGKVNESAIVETMEALKIGIAFDKARRIYDFEQEKRKGSSGLLVAEVVPPTDLG